MEHTGFLPLNLTSHFNRMGGKNRRTSCKKTVHSDKQEMFKELFRVVRWTEEKAEVKRYDHIKVITIFLNALPQLACSTEAALGGCSCGVCVRPFWPASKVWIVDKQARVRYQEPYLAIWYSWACRAACRVQRQNTPEALWCGECLCNSSMQSTKSTTGFTVTILLLTATLTHQVNCWDLGTQWHC